MIKDNNLKEKLESAKNELESLKKQTETSSSQIIQIESLDVGKSFDETKQAFDKVTKLIIIFLYNKTSNSLIRFI